MSEDRPTRLGHKMRAAVMAVAAIANEGCRCSALEEYEVEPGAYLHLRSPYPCKCDTCECYTVANAAITAFHGPVLGKRKTT
jgi:hypothetical protein